MTPSRGDTVVHSETEEGGLKQSRLGRLNGIAAIDDFIEFKTIVHEVDLEASDARKDRASWEGVLGGPSRSHRGSAWRRGSFGGDHDS